MARLAFFGTPDFSLPALRATHRFCASLGHELSLVVTQGDKPQGRGKKTLPPPVKTLALELGIRVLQPSTLKKGTLDGDEFFLEFKNANIDLAIVVAYGKLIPERLLALPARGFINIHGSLLPKFRGAAPIQRAIESGDKETGVCLMDMVKKLDEGDVYRTLKTPILPFDTAESVFLRLSHLGATLLFSSLDDLLHARLKKTPQSEVGLVYAHMLNKDEGKLDFSRSAQEISNKVRAFDPWPGSFAFIRNKRIKFFDSFFIEDQFLKKDAMPGTVVVVGKFLGVKALDGVVYFRNIQVEGKKLLPIKEAVLGFPIAINEQINL